MEPIDLLKDARCPDCDCLYDIVDKNCEWCKERIECIGNIAIKDEPIKLIGKPIKLTLPWPPSVNHYWKRGRNGRMFIGEKGEAFRNKVTAIIFHRAISELKGRLSVKIMAYPPDNRKRDIDNILKALLDALEHGGLYENDNQIDHIDITRCAVDKPGRVELVITETE